MHRTFTSCHGSRSCTKTNIFQKVPSGGTGVLLDSPYPQEIHQQGYVLQTHSVLASQQWNRSDLVPPHFSSIFCLMPYSSKE